MINPRYEAPWSDWWQQHYVDEPRYARESLADDSTHSFHRLVKKALGDPYIAHNELFTPEDWMPVDPPPIWIEPSGDPDATGKRTAESDHYRMMS